MRKVILLGIIISLIVSILLHIEKKYSEKYKHQYDIEFYVKLIQNKDFLNYFENGDEVKPCIARAFPNPKYIIVKKKAIWLYSSFLNNYLHGFFEKKRAIVNTQIRLLNENGIISIQKEDGNVIFFTNYKYKNSKKNKQIKNEENRNFNLIVVKAKDKNNIDNLFYDKHHKKQWSIVNDSIFFTFSYEYKDYSYLKIYPGLNE